MSSSPPPASQPWQPPSLAAMQALLPQYEFQALIGRGGMGAVYKAMQLSLERHVAVKVLPPGIDDHEMNFTERFTIEARTMAKMNHPGIVAVHDFGVAGDGLLYIVMEFVDGTDVQKMIASQGKLKPEHALAITAHVCDALRYAHERQVVHRDIKPANILVQQEGQVKVADFGLAKFTDPACDSGLTRPSAAMGTPDYVAPEALYEGAQVDGRADLYAVGVMLYTMLTGQVPRGMFKMPSQLVGCDARFDQIVRRAMEQNPDDRYASALEMRRDLDRIIAVPIAKPQQAAAPQRVPAARSPAPPKRASMSWWMWAMPVAALIALVIGVLLIKTKPVVTTTATASPPPAAPPKGDAPPPETEFKVVPRPPLKVPVLPIVPTTEAGAKIAEWQQGFLAAMDRDVRDVHVKALSDLDAKYAAALQVLRADASASSDDRAAAFWELRRVETKQPVPEVDGSTANPGVKKLRETYRAELKQFERQACATAQALHQKFETALQTYGVELIAAGKTDQAALVKAKQDELAAKRSCLAEDLLNTEHRELAVALATQPRAKVYVENTKLRVLKPGAPLFENPANIVWREIPALFNSSFVTQAPSAEHPAIKLHAVSDGLVFIACSLSSDLSKDKNERWIRDVTTLKTLQNAGWKAVPSLPAITSTDEKVAWTTLYRWCRAGECFRIRTEKRHGPIALIEPADVSMTPPNLQSMALTSGGTIFNSGTLRPTLFERAYDMMFHDQGNDQNINSTPIEVRSERGFELTDSSLTIAYKTSWVMNHGDVTRTQLIGYADAKLSAFQSLFEACSFNRRGAFVNKAFTSKWNFEDCILSGSFVAGWKTSDYGVRAKQCTFYGIKFPRIEHHEHPAILKTQGWLYLKNCKFVDCEIPESMLIVTQDCLFENCTFGEPDPNFKITSPMSVTIYTLTTIPPPKVGTNRSVQVLDAKQLPSPAGTTLKHERNGNQIRKL